MADKLDWIQAHYEKLVPGARRWYNTTFRSGYLVGTLIRSSKSSVPSVISVWPTPSPTSSTWPTISPVRCCSRTR